MTMRLLTHAIPFLALLLAAAAPCAAQAEPFSFSFYGLEFGTVKDSIARNFTMIDGVVKNPGHGMTSVELVFDREQLLMQIRASWPRPEDPLAHQGLVRALREKFVGPVSAKYPSIAVTLDEFTDRAAVQVVFLETMVREKNIEYHKNRFLETLK